MLTESREFFPDSWNYQHLHIQPAVFDLQYHQAILVGTIDSGLSRVIVVSLSGIVEERWNI
jgi:hypothetical protein